MRRKVTQDGPTLTSPYLLLPEAAAYARVSQSTMRRWCQDGRLRHYKATGPSSPIRIKLEDLEAFLERTVAGAKA